MNFDLTVESPDQKITVYLPKNEADLIDAMYKMIIEGLRCLTYYKYVVDHPTQVPGNQYRNWWGHTLHAYYDLAITHWCRLFGAYKEPTHYKIRLLRTNHFRQALKKLNIIPFSTNSLRKLLLSEADINENEFTLFHARAMKYRNKYLVHKEYIDDVKLFENESHLELEIPRKTFLALFFLFHQVAQYLPQITHANLKELIFYNVKDEAEFYRVVSPSPNFFS